MEKTYDPKNIEQRWYNVWEENNYFKPSGKGPAYCIFLPPPNVTGNLHMGHGFQHTLMDALIRYHRMLGDNVLWQVGTDHAGIATQMVVERQLLQQGVSRHTLGREAFVEKIWQWKEESGGNICRQMRRLGVSADWSRERFTMEPALSDTVLEVFVRLYEEGLIYRGQRLVNWDPTLLTAISDLEVISEEIDAQLWHIRYPFAQGDGHLVVATTRPETLFGDVAVAVNPHDERYQHCIGKLLKLPLTDRTIPVIADDYVDASFGSGCVKITPAHDFNDYAVGQRHQLPLLNIFTPHAKLNDNVPEAYRGLDRFVARKKAIEELSEQGLLEKTQAYRCTIPRGDRSEDVIEPYLTYQWFVKIKPLAEPAIKAVEENHIRFVPDIWSKNYFQWMNNIEDWCISRQLWWGHRIPAWYDEQENIYVGRTLEEVRKKYQLSEDIVLTQETDVLDTWFSSALWPFSTLGWPEQTPELKTWYPSSVLVSGFDIIFFWIARMIMMGLKFTDDVPFHDVFITGLIRDAHGQKMSKTKGNVLDPLDLVDGISLEDLVEKRLQGLMQPGMADIIAKTTRQDFPSGIAAHGMDALRFTFCALATNGRDIRFDFGRLEGYRNFCNKIWNATRFVLMNTEGHYDVNAHCRKKYGLCERWIFSKLQSTIQKAHECFTQYRFDLLAQTLYEFTWSEYCDWYLELVKITIQQGTDEEKHAARHVLLTVLESLLRLMHPIMPFITEEIWQKISPLLNIQGETIVLQPYPTVDVDWIDEEIETDLEWMKKIVLGVRNIRGEMGISPAKAVKALFRKGTEDDRAGLKCWAPYIQNLAKLESIQWLADGEQVPPASTSLVGDLEILIPLAGSIDLTAELMRLNKELDKTQKELIRIETKLSNPNFIEKAPREVVEKEQAIRSELAALALTLRKKIEEINRID